MGAEKNSVRKQAAKTSDSHFSEALLAWHQKHNHRQMPWKNEKDPYKIWLSEIILQQTRVEQGLNYYLRFIAAFPTIEHLANAPEQQVFKLWEGLGYYTRCRNLIASAKYIAQELNGQFPTTYESILALKGVGPYTAAAIASFAFNLPYAVLDGNVFRVLSRICAIDTPVDSTEGKKEFTQLAQSLLSKKNPALYNQAIMDFGATICKPSPACGSCFYQKHCKAFLHGRQTLLPIKTKTVAVKERWFNYFILRYKEQVLIRRREAKDVWQDLFEFVLIETPFKTLRTDLLMQFEKSFGIQTRHYTALAETYADQRLSHQLIHFCFLETTVAEPISIANGRWVSLKDIEHYPFPRSLHQYLQRFI